MPNLRSAAPLVLSLALLLACSSSKTPQPVTPAQPSQASRASHASDTAAKDAAPPTAATAPTPAAAPASPAPPPANAATPEGKGGQVVVVDPGDDPARHTKTLVEAAREERERRAHAGEPVAVITNKNVAHSKGQLTYAQPKAKAAGEKGSGKGGKGKGKAAGETHDEAYWRHRGLGIRQRLHDASEEIGKLEQQVADWRRRFYSEDDPARRDSQVKPEWDRALDKLQHTKEEVETTRHELDAYMEEGRREGALPGWLREGSELESPPPASKPASTDAIEPPVLDEKPPL